MQASCNSLAFAIPRFSVNIHIFWDTCVGELMFIQVPTHSKQLHIIQYSSSAFRDFYMYVVQQKTE